MIDKEFIIISYIKLVEFSPLNLKERICCGFKLNIIKFQHKFIYTMPKVHIV